MVQPTDCSQNTDPLKLVREGTSQDQRLSLALDPAYAPVDERTPAHRMVFARAYSAFLKYYEANNVAVGDWRPFFSEDVSARLAVAAVQDVEFYKANIKACFDFLNNNENKNKGPELKNNLGYLFSYLGTLARQLDELKDGLPTEVSLKGALQNLIQSQLAPVFRRLIAYYKADLSLSPLHPLVANTPPNSNIVILGSTPVVYKDILDNGLSKDWITDDSADWKVYVTRIPVDGSVYGSGVTVFERINHIATHNLFTTIFDQFLKNYARVVNDGKLALEKTFTNWDRHEPHYALFLAFLRLFEYARTEANTLTQRHLDFYYREILRLKEKTARPGHAHLLVELAKHAPTHLLEAGELFKAGKDDLGREAFFANDRDLVVNQAKVAALKTVYRHGNETVKGAAPTDRHFGRLFASPVANSDDGLEAKLTAVDQSWHPFYNKIYQDGVLSEIRMPEAEVGFAIASHYLWMAEGERNVTLDFFVSEYSGESGDEWASEITCWLSSEDGWLKKQPSSFKAISNNLFRLTISLAGDEDSVIAYDQTIHGFEFDTTTPILIVYLAHHTSSRFIFPIFENTKLKKIQIQVNVNNVRNLSLSNDFGLIDASKPFFPFGAQPEAESSLILSSKEVFLKKNLIYCDVSIRWKKKPSLASIAYLPSEQYFPSPKFDYYKNKIPWVHVTWLQEGKWNNIRTQVLFDSDNEITINIKPPIGEFNKEDRPSFQFQTPFSLGAKTGYVRLALTSGFGHKQYREALAHYFIQVANKNNSAVKPVEPYIPEIESLSVKYSAVQTIQFNFSNKNHFDNRAVHFYHLYPFGYSEQHPYLKSSILENGASFADKEIYLLPQLKHLNVVDDKLPQRYSINHEAEFYIGITGLKPPQNLSLLFQVIDGTAAPLVEKPDSHIHWSYLRANEWVAFSENEVEDLTGGLINSGIITFAMPREASDANTLLPPGMYWIRAAVAAKSEAVCRLVLVAAQALRTTFTDKDNDPAFSAKVLAEGTITKLDQPTAAIKKISQPFVTFGGQGMELPTAFYTRVSERLRHKGRAIALWDYERLVLEAFPQIYRVKCLNHTQYEPNESGTGIYRELAPGHVTIVTIPNQRFHEQRDPLRPYTSLGLLEQINVFLLKHAPCFVKLHVRNPKIEEVSVTFNVRLSDGSDELFHVNKLKEAITRFLSPWAFPDGGSPTFGGKIYQAVLLNFIEEQPYVDYVTDFQLFHYVVENDITKKTLKTEVEGTTAVSILVSVPANKHVITVIGASEAQTLRENCSCAP